MTKKYFSRFITTILAIAICMGLGTTAFAAETTSVNGISNADISSLATNSVIDVRDYVDIKEIKDTSLQFTVKDSSVEELVITLPTLQQEALHFYCKNSSTFEVDISSLNDGEHILSLAIVSNGGKLVNFTSAADGDFVFKFYKGTSEFENFGVLNSNLSIGLSTHPKLLETSVNAINEMFTRYPILVNCINQIRIAPNTDPSFSTTNGIALGSTESDEALTITESGLRHGVIIKLNYALFETTRLVYTIKHEMIHALCYRLNTLALGTDITKSLSSFDSYMCAVNYQSGIYELNLRNYFLLKNSYNLMDLNSQIRNYALNNNHEFFSNACAQALTTQGPSELSLKALEFIDQLAAEALVKLAGSVD